MSQNENDLDLVQIYFSNLDADKYLDKKEEYEICTVIEQHTKELLDTCLGNPEFLQQFLALKPAVDRNSVKKVTSLLKNLNDNSHEKEVRKYVNIFYAIFDGIEDGFKVNLLFKDLKLTNNAITTLTKPIKKFKVDYENILASLERSYTFLEVKPEKYEMFVKQCLNDESFVKRKAKELYTSAETIVKYIQTIEDLSKKLISMQKDRNYADILRLCDEISQIEESVEPYRTKIVESTLPLVVSRANRYSRNTQGLELLDLIQEGNIGLMKAIDKFEPEKGYRFTTFATWWIDQAIRRSISNTSNTVRIPIHIQKNLTDINKAFFILSQKNGEEPSIKELAKYCGFEVDEVNDVLTRALHEVSIEEPVGENIKLGDTLVSDYEAPDEGISKEVFQDKLRMALATLSPRSEKIIRLRFGIGEMSDHTLEEIGQRMGLTRERIRQIEKKVLGKLSKKSSLKEGF